MDSMLAGLMATGTPRARNEAASVGVEDRLASTLVRRFCNRHNCRNAGGGKPVDMSAGSPCLHRNHRRDVEAARFMLEELDLGGGVASGHDYSAAAEMALFDSREARGWAFQNGGRDD
jgi:hypothetical protein